MTYLIDFVRTVVIAFVTLFPVVNPIGDAPIFLSLTRQYPESIQKILARKIAAYGFVILAVSLLIGTEILAFLGIKLFVVQIAGGLIVASTGWSLLSQKSDDSSQTARKPGFLSRLCAAIGGSNHRNGAHLCSGRPLLRKCRTSGARAGEIRHRHHDSSVGLRPFRDRSTDHVERPGRRRTPALSRRNRTLSTRIDEPDDSARSV
jgi:hypothetical protein